MATPDKIDAQLARLDGVFSVSTAKLKAITERFVTELAKGRPGITLRIVSSANASHRLEC